ncbi:fungal-specific transcription factor domain-containing protein [Xylariales sp. PMI_506]|nr:fungal-specific transcription factor domain-containing protein [Xylariales sp. PMI_506]
MDSTRSTSTRRENSTGTKRQVPKSPNLSPSRPDHSASFRSKRAKYATAACVECKRRKLKCIKDAGASDCRRCEAGEIACSLGKDERERAPRPTEDESRFEKLEREMADLRNQVTRLAGILERGQVPDALGQAVDSGTTPGQTSVVSAGLKELKEPQFIGTTRPAFGLTVARAALSGMDEIADESSSEGGSIPEERAPAKNSSMVLQPASTDPLLRMPRATVSEMLGIFRKEVESIYPVLDTSVLQQRLPEMMNQFARDYPAKFDGSIAHKDIHLLKAVVATALSLENQGRSELSAQLISSFEDDALRVTSPSDVDLQEIQTMTIMSIYFFFCDEELFAYRCIGIAARMVLELGLHRWRSVQENYPDPEHRSQAIRVFWCVYVLDRRWSFGTGLSFALIDRDIDPQLPQPPSDLKYFRCLVAHGKLCSKVWDAIPQYGSPTDAIPPDVVLTLDTEIQTWFSHIPEDLQLAFAQLGNPSAQEAKSWSPQHPSYLLYLRGNYLRSLIHRHYVLSTSAINENSAKASLAVDIARDSIQILVRLSDGSKLYKRHWVAYNYFLVSAISILLLAVCNAPAQFAQRCRGDFFKAIALVRKSSRLSLQGRRLWSSLRDLIPRLRHLGLAKESTHARDTTQSAAPGPYDISLGVTNVPHSHHNSQPNPISHNTQSHVADPLHTSSIDRWPAMDFSTEFNDSTPDMSRMGDDLLGIFDVFGRRYVDWSDVGDVYGQGHAADFQGDIPFPEDTADEISRHFMGLF